MAIIIEEDYNKEVLLRIAKKMAIAARTAPKGKGANNLDIKILTDDSILRVANKMDEIGNHYKLAFFKRDAKNIRLSNVVILFGCKIKTLGLAKCGLCGLENCGNKNNYPNVPCVFNTTDLGIALGSAASVAMDNRIDSRVMYTIGQAVTELEIFDPAYKIIYGIPLSATSKNPFFDREM